jgi:hypothetical protein
VAFYPDIAVMTVIPVAGDPACVGVRRGLIDAGNPYVAVAVPAVVAVMPGPVRVLVGWSRDYLVDRWRRTDANYDLSLSDACSEDETTDAGE